MDININDMYSLDDRDYNLRIIVNHKKYDTTHLDNIAKYIINNTKWKSMLLIKYDYYSHSDKNNDQEKGGMIFYDKNNDQLYAIETMSLKNISRFQESTIIEKCTQKSIKHAENAKLWTGKEVIPVIAIEYSNGYININDKLNPWKKIETIISPKLLNYKTIIYKIVDDTLEAEIIVDDEPNSEMRELFRKYITKIATESTICTKYFIVLKNANLDILMQEYHEISFLTNSKCQYT